MIPRTVQMAAEVAAQLTSTEIDDYGNIILNGYSSTVPNTTNKKAWQYKETTTPPVNLPSLTEVRPALKGWTTNYMEYYTRLQPNGYGVNPGDPTMFKYSVHSFSPQTGSIQTTSWVNRGSGYIPGTYLNEPLSGIGTGATADIIVTVDPLLTYGPVTAASFVSAGSGYPPAIDVFANRTTTATTGRGTGLTVAGTSNFGVLIAVSAVSYGGLNYEVGDTFTVSPGTGVGRVDAVGPNGVVSSFTIVNPGVGFPAGTAVSAPGLPQGSGFSVYISTIDPITSLGGEPRWAQAPRRRISNQVADYVPPNDNQQAIPYSAILYPVADNPTEPPVDTL